MNRTTNPQILSGLIAATFTPFGRRGEVNLNMIPQVVEHLVDTGISGIYVLGSTGEGASLTVEERKCAAEAFVAAAAGRMPVVVQVGCESVIQAQQLAEHAQSIGADAISAISPVYFKPDSVETLVDAMAEVARAPALPFFYYHIPAATGVRHSMLDFLRIAGTEIPNLRGIKYTSVDVEEFQACVAWSAGEFELVWGTDEMLLDGLQAGCSAAIGSTYNFAAPIYHRLMVAFDAGDLTGARRFQERSQSIVNAFLPFGPRAAQKAIMSLIGLDCGPSRLPIRTLDAAQIRDLRSCLERAAFFAELDDAHRADRAVV